MLYERLKCCRLIENIGIAKRGVGGSYNYGHTWSFMVSVGLGWSFIVIDGHFMQMPLQEANTPVRKKVLPGHAPKDETRNTGCDPRTPGYNVDQSLRN